MTIENTVTVSGQWVELYAATGIPSGNAGFPLTVSLIYSNAPVVISDSVTQPADDDGRISLEKGEQIENEIGDVALWAYCQGLAKLTVLKGQ